LATSGWTWLGSQDRRIVLRDTNTGEVRSQLSSPQRLFSLAFDPAGERLASGDEAGNAVVWDLLKSRPIHQFATGGPIRSIAFLDGGHRLVTHGSDSVLLCNLDTNVVERQVALQGGVRRFVVDSTRNRLVVAFQSGAIGTVLLSGLSAGDRRENTHKGTVECLAISPDGQLLATGGLDHRVVLCDTVSFEPLLRLPEWIGNVRDMAFDASSRRLAVVGSDPDVELWDIAALSNGLTGLALPWDRPSPAAVSTAGASGGRRSSTPEVVVIHPRKTDPAELEEANRLLQSGSQSY
jgi:WD40 repeat protein